MIRSHYRCCCINQPVIFSHCVHRKLGHRFHAQLKVCSDRDDVVPLNVYVCVRSLLFQIHLHLFRNPTSLRTDQRSSESITTDLRVRHLLSILSGKPECIFTTFLLEIQDKISQRLTFTWYVGILVCVIGVT